MDREAAIRCLHQGKRAYRRRVRTGALWFLISFALLSFLLWDHGAWGLSLVMVGLAVFQLFQMILPMDDSDRLMELLENDPSRVVWIYPVEWAVSPFGVHLFRRCYLKLHYADGMIEDLRIPPLDLYGWMRCLNILFPETAFGYTDERKAEFEQFSKGE